MIRSATTIADAYPQLEAFFCGYLHQDFVEEHDDVAGAVAAFRSDARQAERRAVKAEWKTFRSAAAGERLATISTWLRRGLGSAWAPRTWAELEALDRLLGGLR
jgi:hypothetical protein